MWLLAIKAILGDRGKAATCLLGVTFAVVLINLQGGLFLGLIQKASLLVDYGGADVWVGHKHMSSADVSSPIPERWVHRLRSVEGVESAEPYVVAWTQAALPDGRYENVTVIGSDSASLLGNAWEMAHGDPAAVRYPDGVLVDICDQEKLGNCKMGDTFEINGRRARVVGLTKGIVNFTTAPYIFTTLERARRKYASNMPEGHCSYFLVRARPGTDVDRLVQRLRRRVPALDAHDRSTYSRISMQYWMTRTGIGISFGLAAFLGLLVGLAVVAQTLYASVMERIKEFGTLKALGAADECVARFVFAQALGAAVAGSVLGLTGSVILGRLISTPRAPVVLTWWIGATSSMLVIVVCLAAAGLPYWRLQRIDPASILRG